MSAAAHAIHPRLSVHATCSLRNDFAADLTLWETLGVRRVGLSEHKLHPDRRGATMRALRERELEVTSVLTGWFDLAAPASWPARRDAVCRALELAHELGAPVVYTTPGGSDGRSWEVLLEAFADAIGPCVERSGDAVRLAIEPSARVQASFVNTVRDATLVADLVDVGIVVDFANAWGERDFEGVVTGLGSRLALVQVADVRIGAHGLEDIDARSAPPLGRAVPGDGDLDLTRLLRATIDAGYCGPFELEVVGPDIEAEGYAPSLGRSLSVTSALLANVGA